LVVNNFVAISNQWKPLYTTRITCFNKSLKRNSNIATGIPNLRLWCKKWLNWTSGVEVGQKKLTLTLGFLRNLTLTPPKKLLSPCNSAALVTRLIRLD